MRAAIDNLDGLTIGFFDKHGFRVDEIKLDKFPAVQFKKTGRGWNRYFAKINGGEFLNWPPPMKFEADTSFMRKPLSSKCETWAVDKLGFFNRLDENQ